MKRFALRRRSSRDLPRDEYCIPPSPGEWIAVLFTKRQNVNRIRGPEYLMFSGEQRRAEDSGSR